MIQALMNQIKAKLALRRHFYKEAMYKWEEALVLSITSSMLYACTPVR